MFNLDDAMPNEQDAGNFSRSAVLFNTKARPSVSLIKIMIHKISKNKFNKLQALTNLMPTCAAVENRNMETSK